MGFDPGTEAFRIVDVGSELGGDIPAIWLSASRTNGTSGIATTSAPNLGFFIGSDATDHLGAPIYRTGGQGGQAYFDFTPHSALKLASGSVDIAKKVAGTTVFAVVEPHTTSGMRATSRSPVTLWSPTSQSS